MILYDFYIFFLARACRTLPKHTPRGMTLMRAAEAPSHLRHIRAHTPCRQGDAKGEPCRPYIWSACCGMLHALVIQGPSLIGHSTLCAIYQLTCKARSSPFMFAIGPHTPFCNVVSLSGDPRARTMHRQLVPLAGEGPLSSCVQSLFITYAICFPLACV